jgi:hypothetical protein
MDAKWGSETNGHNTDNNAVNDDGVDFLFVGTEDKGSANGENTADEVNMDNEDGETGRTWQSHVHEYIDSTELTGLGSERHNHRFAGLTGEAIYVPGSHVHRLESRTDFYDHYHELHLISGPATFLLDRNTRKSDRKHVHFIEGNTSIADRHCHAFEFATLVEAPLFGENQQDRY